MGIGNGNKFKGNQQKKLNRAQKSANDEFNPEIDRYAKIASIDGGKHVTLKLCENNVKKLMPAIIRGIHHKKLWFNKDDMVVVRDNGNLNEIWRKVTQAEIHIVQKEFDKLDNENGSSGNDIIFREPDANDTSESSDDESNNVDKHLRIAPQPTRKFVIDNDSDDDNDDTDGNIQNGKNIEIDDI